MSIYEIRSLKMSSVKVLESSPYNTLLSSSKEIVPLLSLSNMLKVAFSLGYVNTISLFMVAAHHSENSSVPFWFRSATSKILSASSTGLS